MGSRHSVQLKLPEGDYSMESTPGGTNTLSCKGVKAHNVVSAGIISGLGGIITVILTLEVSFQAPFWV